MIPRPDDDDPLPSRPLTPLLAVMLAFIAFSLQTLIIEVLVQITGPGTNAPIGIGTILGYGIAFTLAVAQLPGDPAATLGFRAARARSWIAALLFVPSQILTSELHNVLREHWPPAPLPEGAAAAAATQGLAATLELAVILIVVLPVVFEIFFRGLLQPRLVPYWGSLGALLGVAVLAAVSGVNLVDPRSLPLLFGSALLAGVLRRSSGSLYPGLLLSMSFGVIDVLASRKVFGIPGFDLMDVPHTPLSFLIVPAAMLGIGLALCRGEASLTREDVVSEAPPEEPPAA
jgi:membrane protease YdiL (CAAX protease family)